MHRNHNAEREGLPITINQSLSPKQKKNGLLYEVTTTAGSRRSGTYSIQHTAQHIHLQDRTRIQIPEIYPRADCSIAVGVYSINGLSISNIIFIIITNQVSRYIVLTVHIFYVH